MRGSMLAVFYLLLLAFSKEASEVSVSGSAIEYNSSGSTAGKTNTHTPEPVTESLSLKHVDKTTVSTTQDFIDNSEMAQPTSSTHYESNNITQDDVFARDSTTQSSPAGLNFFTVPEQRDGTMWEGKRLVGHTFMTRTGQKDYKQCALECLKYDKCASFNFQSTEGNCELNEKTHLSHPYDVQNITTFKYHDRLNSSSYTEMLGPCAGQPCRRHGRCLETRSVSGEPSAVCLCEGSWTGTFCHIEGGAEWTTWMEWSSCSVTCHRGWRLRKRSCRDSTTLETLNAAQCYGASQEYGVCQLHDCPRWEEWGEWSECSTETTCGRGTKTRTRSCSNGGQKAVDRHCFGMDNETSPCYSVACNGGLKLASGVSPGEGRVELYDNIRQRWTYICAQAMTKLMADLLCKQAGWPGAHAAVTDGRFGQGDGKYHLSAINCTETENHVMACSHTPWTLAGDCKSQEDFAAGVQCNVNGAWSLWSTWSECSVSCENGTQVRRRFCNHPVQMHNGRPCRGEDTEYKHCNLPMCPVDGEWDEWSGWSNCSVTCGTGLRTRQRACQGPEHNGAPCVGSTYDAEKCNTHECPVDGFWMEWEEWSECSTSCGGGEQKRTRLCREPEHGGAFCIGSSEEFANCSQHECPVDGVWNPWSEWSECSVTCAWGWQWRNRTCDGPYYEGAPCEGDDNQTQACHPRECPVDGKWLPWSDWGKCSLTCGNGTQWRSRECDGPAYDGANCTGPYEEEQSCNTHACPVDGSWKPWSEWGYCSVTCDGGVRKRDRECDMALHGGKNCTGPSEQIEACNNHSCPIDGVWESWSDWEPCTVTCDGGSQSRYRNCTGPYYGGHQCLGQWNQTQNCSTHNCPEDGVFSSWSEWGDCDVSCGGGVKERNRSCIGPFYGGKDCEGHFNDTATCNTHECPVDGVFDTWSEWSVCTTTCGGGTSWRSRNCTGPFHGGQECLGEWQENKTCNDIPCPEDGEWLPWTDWTTCSVTCGGGNQTRERTCNGILHGGKPCDGENNQTQVCKTHNCPEDGVFDEWSDWSRCTLTCGSGTQWRNRSCIGPFHGGQDCEGEFNETQNCNEHNCPVDGYYNEWADWSRCSVSCGGGSQWRNRTCTLPEHGGLDCQGPDNETQECNIHPCPVDGYYNEWADWSTCSVSCGGGSQWRNRTCALPEHGGLDCQGPDNETQECNIHPCPVDGWWLEWSLWSECSHTCGPGLRDRTRLCREPEHGGKACEGSSADSEDCNEASCLIPGDWFDWAPWSSCTLTCGGGTRHRERECDLNSYLNLTAPCEGHSEETSDCHTFPCRPLARTCTEWGELGLMEDTYADIDPDGTWFGSLQPVVVFCDMTSNDGIGVTVVGHDQEARREVTDYEDPLEFWEMLNYNISLEHVISIIDLSSNCEQYIKWECHDSHIHKMNEKLPFTGWLTRYDEVADYFGGATPGSGSCACGMTGTCAVAGTLCNCDANDAVWRQDEGNLTFKDDLPVLAFMAGDTGGIEEMGYSTVGPIRCYGKDAFTFRK